MSSPRHAALETRGGGGKTVRGERPFGRHGQDGEIRGSAMSQGRGSEGHGSGISRRSFLTAAGAGVLAGVGAGLAGQRTSLTIPPTLGAEKQMRGTGEVGGARETPNPDQALRRLMAGNQRYVASRSTILSNLRARRLDTANSQHPFAVVLGCADSRVPVEVVFDHGIGEIFTIRVAGNTLNDLVTGSLEFALEELHVPLVMVLGHQRCGAVKAAIDSVDQGKPAPGNIDAVIRSIRPVITSIKGQSGDRLANGVRANVRAVVDQLKANPMIAGLTRERKLKLVGAYYTLSSGKVDIVT